MTSYDALSTTGVVGTDTTPSAIRAHCLVSETGTLTDVAAALKHILEVATAGVVATSSLATVLETINTISDGMVVGAAAVVNKAVIVALSEGATLTAAVTPNAILRLLAAEGVSFAVIVSLDGEEYVVWVANADTFAHSQYSGFDFNSMCRLGEHYYGAKDDGIYLLEGSDDAGDEIQWYMTLPTTEFGTAKQKRVPKAYMGISNAGDMHIKVITREGNTRVYAFGKTSQGYSESGAALGRGIKSRYWTFDLYNVDGGDAEIERIEFFPVILQRLINS